MTLKDICHEVAIIEEGLAYGEIPFSCDKQTSATKPGHPADLLDDILSRIGWDVMEGKAVEIKRVQEWVRELKAFKTAFKIKELSNPIKHAEQYIMEQEGK